MKMTISLVINMSSNLMITCPVCGYTFRNTFKKENLGPEKTKIICPMCNFKFKDPNIPPKGLDEFLF